MGRQRLEQEGTKQGWWINLAREAIAASLWLLAFCLLISLVSYKQATATQNWLGLIGHGIGGLLQFTFGLASYLLPILLVSWGITLWRSQPRISIRRIGFGTIGLLSSVSLLLTVLGDTFPQIGLSLSDWIYSDQVTHYGPYAYREARFHLGGCTFSYLYSALPLVNLHRLLSPIGTTLFGTLGLTASLFALTKFRILQLLRSLVHWWRARREIQEPTLEEPAPLPEPEPLVLEPEATPQPPRPARAKAAPKVKKYTGDFRSYKLPSPQIFTAARKIDQSVLKQGLRNHAQVLEETLASFGIEAKVGEINCGPTITSFEVQPAVGVKVQRIRALQNDIALNLKAKSIRILAPIPGKAAVGVEIPNPRPQEVGLREMIEYYKKKSRGLQIPLFLGKAVNGDDVVADMTKMPHLIIAGATGSGKSVCLNAIIMSVLMTARPDEVRLLMVDPKKVELTLYSELPHMIAPVITEPREACTALGWLVKEMEKRYELLKLLGVRNIIAFNDRKRDAEFESSLEIEVPERMSYIVAIVDELADLMMVSSSDIETPITRIAQMARAVGIHLILATQRPSREVITGLIKANFPARIGFKVSSRVNSQIILDEPGAENLLGNGDMLFLPPGTANLLRAQGAYVRDEDINKVIQEVCSQAPTNYLIQSFVGGGAFGGEDEEEDVDDLYQDARNLIITTGLASTTYLQRKLKIGYARAASIMDQLEANGIIGPAEGAKPRQILAGRSQ